MISNFVDTGPFAGKFIRSRQFSVLKSDKEIAQIYLLNSKEYYTAANIFNVCFIKCLDYSTEAVEGICALVKNDLKLEDSSIEVFSLDVKIQKWPCEYIPKDWYLVDKDEFGSILSSFKRSIDNVIRKYGEEKIA